MVQVINYEGFTLSCDACCMFSLRANVANTTFDSVKVFDDIDEIAKMRFFDEIYITFTGFTIPAELVSNPKWTSHTIAFISCTFEKGWDMLIANTMTITFEECFGVMTRPVNPGVSVALYCTMTDSILRDVLASLDECVYRYYFTLKISRKDFHVLAMASTRLSLQAVFIEMQEYVERNDIFVRTREMWRTNHAFETGHKIAAFCLGNWRPKSPVYRLMGECGDGGIPRKILGFLIQKN